MTEIEKAYAAGLFDGEGHICISFQAANPRRSYKGKSARFQLSVVLSQNDLECVEWLAERFGGSVRYQEGQRSYDRGRYQRWDWRLSTQKAADFLVLIRPYLIIKAREADVALRFQSSMVKNTGRRPLSANILEFRQQCFDDIRALRGGKKMTGPKQRQAG